MQMFQQMSESSQLAQGRLSSLFSMNTYEAIWNAILSKLRVSSSI